MSTATASAVLLTIEGLHGCVDLELSGDVPIATLLPPLLQHRSLADARDPQDPFDWVLSFKGGHVAFDPANALHHYEVVDGAYLTLQTRQMWDNRQPEPAAPDPVLNHQPALVKILNKMSFLSGFMNKFKS